MDRRIYNGIKENLTDKQNASEISEAEMILKKYLESKGLYDNGASLRDDVVMYFGRKPITTPELIIIICWFTSFVIMGMIILEGLQSFFKYYDEIELGSVLTWLLRKDQLEVPTGPLVIALIAITLIYGGVEISVSFLMNRESERGDIKPIPKKQRDRLFSLVTMWIVMSVVLTLAKAVLGTRGVDYQLILIYSGYGEALTLFTLAQRIPKSANQISGNKDRIHDAEEMAAAMNTAKNEPEDYSVEPFEEEFND